MVGTWCPSANSDDVVFVALILHSLRGLELHIHTLCHVTLQFLQPQSGWHMLLHPVGDELGQMPCHGLCSVGSSGPVPLWSRDPRIHPCLSSASLCPCDLPWKDHAPGGHCAGILGPGMRHAEEMGTPLKAGFQPGPHAFTPHSPNPGWPADPDIGKWVCAVIHHGDFEVIT